MAHMLGPRTPKHPCSLQYLACHHTKPDTSYQHESDMSISSRPGFPDPPRFPLVGPELCRMSASD